MKKLLLKGLLLVTITVVPLLVVNYIIDPLQCFRTATWYTPLYDPNERVQSPCLVRTHDFDTIIVGASHVENFDPVYVDNALDAATLKTAIAASTLYEQNKLMNLAVDSGKLKHVVWGLDTNILFDEPDRVRDDIVPFPFHIYEPAMYNNILFLLDPYIYKHYVKMVIHHFTGIYDDFTQLRYLNYWEDKFTFSRERMLEFYDMVQKEDVRAIENTNNDLIAAAPEDASTENIDNNVVRLVEQNPDVTFNIFFPPYSILRFVDLYEKDRNLFEIELKLKQHLIDRLLTFEHVHLYDFQHEDKITFDLNNYKDLSHFSSNINQHIIDALKKKESVLQKEQSSSTISSLRRQVENFDFSQTF